MTARMAVAAVSMALAGHELPTATWLLGLRQATLGGGVT